MRVLGRGVLEGFGRRHARARSRLRSWLAEAEEAEWESPADVLRRFPHASFITGERVVFNIGGNNYRLDARIDFQRKLLLVVRVGTHSEYDRWRF